MTPDQAERFHQRMRDRFNKSPGRMAHNIFGTLLGKESATAQLGLSAAWALAVRTIVFIIPK